MPRPAGAVAVIDVGPLTWNRARVLPNDTEVAPVNPEPSMVTVVIPEAGPLDGVMVETLGAGW
jgi:hypothetical protein